MNFFQTFYLTHFSKPVEERVIYRSIQTDRPRKVLEIGIQKCVRTTNLLQLVLHYCGDPADVHYTAIDPFEGRTMIDGPGLSLRKAHRMINHLGVKSRLCPQPPEVVIKQLFLNRVIEKVDLLVVATPCLDWFPACRVNLPELIHESTTIFIGLPTSPNLPYVYEKFGLSEFERILSDPRMLKSVHKKVA